MSNSTSQKKETNSYNLRSKGSLHQIRMDRARPPPMNMNIISTHKSREVNKFEEAFKNYSNEKHPDFEETSPKVTLLDSPMSSEFKSLEAYKKKILFDMKRIISNLENVELNYINMSKSDYISSLKRYLKEFDIISDFIDAYAETKILLYKYKLYSRVLK